MQKEKIFTLDILRILAAFVVFIFHLTLHCGLKFQSDILNNLFTNGAVFMVLFFMLSGFLLYYRYQDKNLINPEQLSNFFINRFIRIYPVYLLFIFTTYFTDKSPLITKIVLLPNELLMMQSVYSSTNDYLNNSGTWFISTIFILYIFYPYIQHLLKNNKINIIYIIITLIFFSVYPSIILAYFNENITTIYSNPIFRIPEFTIGMCIAKIYTANKHKKYSVMIPAFLSLITVVTISILCHNNFINHISFRYKYPLFNIAVVPLFGLIIYFTALIKSKSVISFCKSFPVQYSAKISFAFYIVQCWTFYIYYTFLKNNLSSSVTAMCILLFVINILFSILVYEIIEKRLITILKTIIYKKIQN